jgi:hypothetical protein
MRKGITDGSMATVPLTQNALQNIEKQGFKYVQVKGLTTDKHYDYIDPSCLVLIPMKELPVEQDKKDIYEPVTSALLQKWASEKQDYLEIVIAK